MNLFKKEESNCHLNIENLALRKDTVKAVKEKKFHIYSVKTIDEGIEILTGVKAGKIQKDGTYQKGSVNYLVNQKLLDLTMKMKQFGEKKKEKNPIKKGKG